MSTFETRLLQAIVLACAMASAGCAAVAAEERSSADPVRVQKLTAHHNDRIGNAEWLAPAMALRKEGDRLYLAGDYSGAAAQYRDAYPNVPQGYTFVMASDATLRAVLLWNRPLQQDPSKCLRSDRLAERVHSELTQVYAVGLAVGASTGDDDFLKSAVHARAKGTERCLAELEHPLQSAPPGSCASLAGLAACLGTPLIERNR